MTSCQHPSDFICLDTRQKNQQLWHNYQQQKSKNPMLFPTEASQFFAVSELALLLSSPNSRYMGNNCRDVLEQLANFSQIESIVRNNYAVHEKQGCYKDLKLNEKMGLMVNVGGLDLRYFIKEWHHMLSVNDVSNPEKPSYSIQFFDGEGNAVNKVYLRDLSADSVQKWQTLVEQQVNSAPTYIELETSIEKPEWQCRQLSSDDKQILHEKWLSMTDIHQFYGILKNLEIDRASSYHQAPENMAVALMTNRMENLLERVRDNLCPVMIFVGNTGVVQIQTGTIKTVKRLGDWLNILDKSHNQFTLHLKDSEISQLWCVKRPTVDGIITCIEGFDKQGTSIFTMFGQRQEGQQELASWRDITQGMIEEFALTKV